MKIPTYTSQVKQIVPTVPMPRQAQITQESMGSQVYEAQSNLAKVGENIATAITEHIQKENLFHQKAVMADAEKDYSIDQQNLTYNEQMQSVERDGNTYEIPSGFLNRTGADAIGITQEYDKWHQDNVSKYIDKVTDPEIQKDLLNKLNNKYIYKRDDIIKHEANEKKNMKVRSFTANLNTKLNSVQNVSSEDEFLFNIKDGIDIQKNIGIVSGQDSQTIDNLGKDWAGNYVSKKAMSILSNTGDIDEAIKWLDLGKDYISPDRYEKTIESLSKREKTLNSELSIAKRMNTVKNRFNYFNKLSSGEINLDNVDTEILNIQKSGDFELAEALRESMDITFDIDQTTGENKSFYQNVETLFNSGSKEEIAKNLVGILKNDGKKLSRERLAILLRIASQKKSDVQDLSPEQKGIPVSQENFMSSAWSILKDYLIKRTGVPMSGDMLSTALNSFLSRADKEKAVGEQFLAIANDEIKRNILKSDPSISKISTDGELRTDKYGTMWIQYPNGDHKLIQKSTGEFIQKDKRKIE